MTVLVIWAVVGTIMIPPTMVPMSSMVSCKINAERVQAFYEKTNPSHTVIKRQCLERGRA